MQVNKVDNNTNFKMALKINPNLQPKIAQRGSDFLVALNDYGKRIADVRLYNVVLDESLNTPKIFHHAKNTTRDYFAELKNEEKLLGKYYEVPAGFGGETRGGFFPDEPRVFRKLYGEKANAKYDEFKNLDIYEQAAEYSRMLEELDVKRMVEQEKEKHENIIKNMQEKEMQRKLNQEINELIENYRYDPPAQKVETTQKTKKSWWQRIFG